VEIAKWEEEESGRKEKEKKGNYLKVKQLVSLILFPTIFSLRRDVRDEASKF
jgi:hypothetical protein